MKIQAFMTTLAMVATLSVPATAEVIFDSMPGDVFDENVGYLSGYLDSGSRFVVNASRFIVEGIQYSHPTVYLPLHWTENEPDPTFGTMDVRIHRADNPDRFVLNGDPNILAPGTVLGEITLSNDFITSTPTVYEFFFPEVTLEPGDYYVSIGIQEEAASQVRWVATTDAALAQGGAFWESDNPDEWTVFEVFFGYPPAAMRIDAEPGGVAVESRSFSSLKAMYR